MMKDILNEIVSCKRIEVERMKEVLPERQIHAMVERLGDDRLPSLSAALMRSHTGIIAEFKRCSPSKGWISEAARADVVPMEYQRNGASAVSILTDEAFFGGADRFVKEARESGVVLPILYKNFIVDEYQLFQARLCGASSVLLIASVLDMQECRRLMAVARELGMEVLLELHGEGELDYAGLMPDVCGVNNRNLGTFVTDVDNSFRLASRLPAGVCKVSESGISGSDTIVSLRLAGFNGFLIGESFMKAERPGEELARYVREVERQERERSATPFYIKVCGLREPGNVGEVASLDVDMLGFIFHEGSRRHVSPQQMDALCGVADGARRAGRRSLKVGVFVDAPQDDIISAVKRYGLDCVQMHGGESVGRLAALRNALDAEAKRGVRIIKALSIATREDVMQGSAYAGVADMLLFDTKGEAAGGNGKRFDWNLLDAYDGPLPFLLSGGIGSECVADIAAVSHPRLAGIDLNSRFETSPGMKYVDALARFIGEIKALRK